MITEEAVLKALGYVDDPDLNKDLVTLGMIQKLEVFFIATRSLDTN